MKSFIHIVNPFPTKPDQEKSKIQEHTLYSLGVAAKKYNGKLLQIGVCFPDEIISYSHSLKLIPQLKKSLNDFVKTNKKLPLLKEILNTSIEKDEYEYVIYSNMDIIISPDFYNTINYWLNHNPSEDTLIINRRRVQSKFIETSLENQYLIFSETGEEHPGFDCFIFKRALIKKFRLGNVCIGIPNAENCLLHNLIAFSKRVKIKSDSQLTFHIGMELHKNWGNRIEEGFNYREFKKSLNELKDQFELEKFPGVEDGFFKRNFRWLMHPSFSFPIMLKLELKSIFKRKKKKVPKDKLNMKNRYLDILFKYIKID